MASFTLRSTGYPHSAIRDGIRRIVPTHGRHYRWMCSQFRAKAIFTCIQLVMLFFGMASLLCITNLILVCCPSSLDTQQVVFAFAVANILCAFTAFVGIHIAERVHRLGSRLWDSCTFPPFILLIPSYICQVADLIALGIWMYFGLKAKIQSGELAITDGNDIWNRIIMKVTLPLVVTWLFLIYVFLASVDFLFYAARKSRYWHRPTPLPAILTAHNYTNDEYSLGTWSTRKNSFERTATVRSRSTTAGLPHLPSSPCLGQLSWRFKKNERERLSSLSSGSHANNCESSPKNLSGSSAVSLETRDASKLSTDCARLLHSSVTPVKRQLETVVEESKSQVSGEITSLDTV